MEHRNVLVHSARQFVEEHGHRRLGELYSNYPEAYDKVYNFLFHIRYGSRLWMVSTETLMGDFWEQIRESEAVCDFIMTLTAELRLALVRDIANGETHGDWQKLCRSVATAYGSWGVLENRRGATTAIDEDTYVRLPQAGVLEELLRENPWFVTLYFCNHIPLLAQRGQAS